MDHDTKNQHIDTVTSKGMFVNNETISKEIRNWDSLHTGTKPDKCRTKGPSLFYCFKIVFPLPMISLLIYIILCSTKR